MIIKKLVTAMLLSYASFVNAQSTFSRDSIFKENLKAYEQNKIEQIATLPDDFILFENEYLQMRAYNMVFDGLSAGSKYYAINTMFIDNEPSFNSIRLGNVYSVTSIINNPDKPSGWESSVKDIRLKGDIKTFGIKPFNQANLKPENRFKPFVEDIIITPNTVQEYVFDRLKNGKNKIGYEHSTFTSVNFSNKSNASNYNLGANITFPKNSIDINYSVDNTSGTTSCEVKFYVRLCNIEFDLDSLSSVKNSKYIANSLSPEFNPVYVSNIYYGYIVTLKIDGNYSIDQIKKALNMSYNTVGGSYDSSNEKTISNLKVSYQSGGVVGLDGIKLDQKAIDKGDLGTLISSFTGSISNKINELIENGAKDAVVLGVQFKYLYDNKNVEIGRLINDKELNYGYQFKFKNGEKYYQFNFKEFEGYNSPKNDRLEVKALVHAKFDKDKFKNIINNLEILNVPKSVSIPGVNKKEYNFESLKSTLIKNINILDKFFYYIANEIDNTANQKFLLYSNECFFANPELNVNPDARPWFIECPKNKILDLGDLVKVSVEIFSDCKNTFFKCEKHNSFINPRIFNSSEVGSDGEINSKKSYGDYKLQNADNGQYKIHYYWSKSY